MKSFLLKSLLLLTVLVAGLAAAAWWSLNRPLALAQDEVDFIVPRGATMRQVAQEMAAAGIPIQPELFYWAARLDGRADRIRAGSYVAEDGSSAMALLDKLVKGEVTRADVLLVEGWRFSQMRAAIESHPYLLQDSRELTDAELLLRIGASETHPEGLFFPDTYVVDRYSSALLVYQQAYDAMQRRLQAAWAMRDERSPLRSPYEALILASIIEKETGRAEERGLVASVFSNRLRIGMRLQTDPTVIYGFGDTFEGRLRKRHLETDHAYNTYTRAGLPPTPIALPGWAALEAAVKPEQSEYLYFVARGNGTSQFSRNLADHNRAVNRYQRGLGGG